MNNIEDIYSLSPTQAGLLFHSVYEPDSRVYYQQLALRMQGNLDIDAFTAAWKALVKRHSIMRTAFLWEDLDDAYQVVQHEVPLPLTVLDWRGTPDQNIALAQLELDERSAAFDLAEAPLMRLCLVQLNGQQWQLIWTFHHIVMDGWSVGVAMQEWLSLYQDRSGGVAANLAPARNYKDYIAWQSQRDSGATDIFWRGQLADVCEPTPLPNMAVRSNQTYEFAFAERQVIFSAAETAVLQAFVRTQHLTVNTLFQGAWALLLGHHAGRDDVVYGVTVAGRPADLAASDAMVGLFINTLPLRVQWSANPLLGDWLHELQERNTEVRQHGYLPLAKLKPFSQVPADRPLFDSILVFENFPLAQALNQEPGELAFISAEDAYVDGLRLTRGRNHFPLSLMVVPGDQLEFIFSYERKRFSDDEISVLAGQLKTLLFTIATQSDTSAQTRVNALRWISDREQSDLNQWSCGPVIPVPQLCLHQLVEQHASRTPDQIALIARDQNLTYRKLNEQANQVSHLLADKGVRPGSIVALALDRCTDFVVSLLAIFKAGAAYLPLDLKQPAARLADIVADSDAVLLIGHSTWQAKTVVAGDIPTLWLDNETVAINAQPATAPDIDHHRDNAAYVIYTSGSTGAPKGVVVEHGALVSYLAGIDATFGLPKPARYAMLSTVAADLGHTQLFGALSSGGILVLVDSDTSFNPPELARFLGEHQVDVLKITPSHLRGLLSAHQSTALLPTHTLIFGGEALDRQLVASIRELSPNLRIFNHYGPTEATVGAVATPVTDLAGTTGFVPLGKPLPNRQVHVLDEDGHPVAIGVPGELYLGGVLARGYLNRPQLTSEHFVMRTINGHQHRLYRTGDRVRWLSSGELMFLGRTDNQVKIRGNRIELGEVEAQVKLLAPKIRQVVARVIQGDNQPARLVAYIVADESLSPKKLHDDLSIRVPDYMVPTHFITLDAIPLTANGKTDFRQLPLPEERQAEMSEYVAPRNDIERILAEIWQDVLKLERISVHDNFFTLGGDSILNLQIIARANQQGLKLTPKQLFEKRTIAEISAVLTGTAELNLPLQTNNRPVELCAGQLAQLENAELQPTWRCVALATDVAADHVLRALAALQQQHPALRLGLSKGAGGKWQQELLAQPKQPAVSEHSLSLTETDSLGALAQSLSDNLDIAAGEILHASIITDRDTGIAQLLILGHPLCIDERSWPLILTDLNLALNQLHYGRPLALGQTSGDFPAWSEHQTNYACSDTLDSAWEHWLQYAGMDLPQIQIQAEATVKETSQTPASLTLSLTPHISARLQSLQTALRLEWTDLLASAVSEQIHTLRSATESAPVVLDIDCGRPQGALFPARDTISAAQLNPAAIVGALSLATPVFLDISAAADPLQALQQLAAQRLAQPQQGAAYGVLRYLSDNTYLQEPLLSLPKAQISIGTLGNWDAHREHAGILQSITAANFPRPIGHALTVNLFWRDDQLHLHCAGSLAKAWAPVLEQRLVGLVEFANTATLRPAAQRFPLCEQQVHSLQSGGKPDRESGRASSEVADNALDWTQVEDIYPLSPMQHGMLLHTLLQPHSGIYLMQQRYSWDGQLNRKAIEKTWQLLLQRHPMLRTGFIWQDDHEPLQCVYRHTDPAFEWYDWRHLDANTQQQQMDSVLAAERQRGFDMARAPLTFLRVFQLGEHQFNLVRSFHHILTDAWCFGLLMEDLLAIYQTQVRNEPVARPALRPFSSYMRWLARQDASAAEAFWHKEMAGFNEPTPLVVDTPVSNTQTEEDVGDVNITLSIAQTQRLQQLCQQHQLTPNTWIQGAWATLLSRYSGQPNVMFGITVAGRPADLTGVEDIVGLFINSLPLRVTVETDKPVITWLQDLLAHNVELRSYEYASLVDIQRWSEIPRGQPLFNSLVVFENAPLDVSSADQQEFSIDIFEDRVHTNFPMTVVIYPGDRLGIRLSYDARRFTRDIVERMLGHLVQLLADMLNQPDGPVNRLNMLTDTERQTILFDWNATAVDFPLEQTYAELFTRTVNIHKDKIAAVCNNESLTYAELDRRANCVAQALQVAGAGPDSLVALAGERGLSLLVMMIGTLKAGAAFQSLDINHPTQRLGELMNLGEAPVLLVSSHARPLMEQVQACLVTPPAMLIVEELWQGSDNPKIINMATANNLAYVIFTSGSTGTPKGAMVEQRGMLNNIFGKVPSIELGEADRIAQTASPAFDISIWQFLAAPLLGGTVHILPDAVAQDPLQLLEAVDISGLTVLEAVPAIIQGMLQERRPHHRLVSLRWLLPTGEALPPALCRHWFAQFPAIPLMNAYGPAECADDVAFHPVTETPPVECLHMPIGRPTANNQLFILDSTRRPVPIGVSGEICVAGAGVGRGYLKDEERTREAFIDHPFSTGDRFYRTGDIGRYRNDGVIEYLGRKDQQVKIRGHRIELGEIESRLARHPAVQAAAVIALPDQRGTLQLIACYVTEVGRAVSSAELAEHLREQLAAYMVPHQWLALDALPLNANGKVDRRALAQQTLLAPLSAARNLVVPATITEQRILAIWQEILDSHDISTDDNFFAIGGHSLLATQVMSRIRRQLGVELPLKVLFDQSTIAALATAADAITSTAKTEVDIPAVARTQSLPLSYAQQRLWFLDQLEGASGAYNISAAVKLTGTLDRTAVQATLDTILQRHESLRTRFTIEGDTPRQVVVPTQPFAIVFDDLSAQDDAQQAASVQRLIDAEAERPFDLTCAPMMRVLLLRLADDRYVMQFTLHHIATDAWSMGVLVKEFIHCYEAFTRGTTPALTPLPIQYGDYAHWQRSEAQQQQLSRSVDYWRRELQGAPTLIHLPQDYERPAAANYDGAALSHSLSNRQTKTLKAYGQQTRSTLFMVLLNAFNSVLQRATGELDFIVGTDLANRDHLSLENLIGFFVNVLPLRAQLNEGESFTQRLAQLRTQTLDAFQHQRVPFDKLVELLQPPRQAGVNPLVQVLFVMQNTPATEARLPGLLLEELNTGHETSKFDLAVFVDESDEQLSVRWLYRTSLFKPETIANLQRGFESLLEYVVEDADQALAQWQWRLAADAAVPPSVPAPADDSKARKLSKLGKLKNTRAAAISLAPEEQVKLSSFAVADAVTGHTLPLVVEPRLAELDPFLWATQAKPWVESLLRTHGGVLFRGFNLPDAMAFEQFAQAIEPSLYGQYGDLPKNTSGKNIYHSTPYPEKQMILYHNESSHLAKWPRKQWFYCELPARKGGCTPIVDCRKMYQHLPADIIATLERKGLLYVRHFTDKLDVRWQDFFKTESRADAEAQCLKSGMRFEWFGADNLRTEQFCEAVVAHPETGEKIFFNQVQLHHEACLEPEIRSNLISLFGPDRLPRNVYYGDGSRIEDEVMAAIGRAYEACAVRFDWRKGDVIMLDNMLVAHARDPFEGDRKICVAMGQMYERSDLARPAARVDKSTQAQAELTDSV